MIVWHELVEEAGFHLGQSDARGGRESRLGYLGQGLAGAGDHLHADLYVPTGPNISEEHRWCPQRTLDSRSTPSAIFGHIALILFENISSAFPNPQLSPQVDLMT